MVKLSLAFNLLFLALFLTVGIWKFDSLSNRAKGAFGRLWLRRQTSQAVLQTFNNDVYEDVLNETFVARQGARTVEFLFLGNSLTYCGVPEEEPDKTRRGLTSTRIENDYVHRLVSMYAKRHGVNVRFSAVNIAGFERGFADKKFSRDSLIKADVQSPDYVIFQIGENVSNEDITANGRVFFERYRELAGGFGGAKKVVCLPFWPSREKINVITEVALATGSAICDLSHLGSGIDKDNFASSHKKYRQPGVGAHPGDVGMERIAQNILSVLPE